MKKIIIKHYENPENPFTEWDCEPDLMWEGGRNHKEDYSKGNIAEFIAGFPSDGQIIKHQQKLSEIIEFSLEYFKINEFSKEDKVSDIRTEIENACMDDLIKICQLFKIPHKSYTSTGYSQGDWADVLIVLTDEFFKRTGCDRKNIDSILDGATNLFNAYMWGDVFGYTIYESIEMVKLSRKDFESGNCDNVEHFTEDIEIDSCGGFYGDDWFENGMSDHIPEELHELLKATEITYD